jgi:hypothetical protein
MIMDGKITWNLTWTQWMMLDENLGNFFGPPYFRWPMGLMKIATTHGNKKFSHSFTITLFSFFILFDN